MLRRKCRPLSLQGLCPNRPVHAWESEAVLRKQRKLLFYVGSPSGRYKDLRREGTGSRSLRRLALCQDEAAMLGFCFYPDVAKRFTAHE